MNCALKFGSERLHIYTGTLLIGWKYEKRKEKSNDSIYYSDIFNKHDM